MRERVLLHVCCAPCATHPVNVLSADHDVTLFFSNSNISPAAEFERRLCAARELAARMELPLLVDDYDHDLWLAEVSGLEKEPEKGKRCHVCFRFSLARTAAAAEAGGFDGFTTTLTVSPHKSSPVIFGIGEDFEEFKAVNFKKQDGFRESVRLSREYGLYRQGYCGCEFSAVPPS
jgi:epoxyqueuosine reductase